VASYKWENDVKVWIINRKNTNSGIAEDFVQFFKLAFNNTYHPEKAWFGAHTTTLSLVVGGIFLASAVSSGNDRGIWLLLDMVLEKIDGFEYRPVKSTLKSKTPLVWLHSAELKNVSKIIKVNQVWASYFGASQKIFNSAISRGHGDKWQISHKKRRLIDFWNTPQSTQPDSVSEQGQMLLMAEEMSENEVYIEGATRQVLINAYERNQQARSICIEHYGCICTVCEINFAEIYGKIGAGFIHVHHLIEISTIGEKYIVDPIKDLRPVCPNCHAMLHRKRPAFTINELKDIVGGQKLY
jgi:hypothetical protein